MSLPIIRFRSKFPLFLVLSCEGCVLGVSSAPQTEGLFTLGLQSAETPGERGEQDRREMCAAILCPSPFSLPCYNFLCVLEMLERWMLQFYPLFFTFGERNAPCIVPVF